MTIRKQRPSWKPVVEGATTPLYLTIANQLAADIASGKLEPHTRLPTHRDLAWDLGCTVGTITRAYAEAERRGLIHGEVGRGSFVRPPALPYPEPVAPRSIANPTGDPRARTDAPTSNVIDLAMNWPSPAGEDEKMRETLRAIASGNDMASLLEFTGRLGVPRHRDAGAALLNRRYQMLPKPERPALDPSRVLIAAGTQHALMIALAALAAPGDAVLVEDLTYPGIVSLARLMRLRLKPVACDADGPRPEALEAACRTGDARAFYIVPTQHNPTGRTISETRRRRLAEIVRQYDLPTVEDDVYGYFPLDAPPPLAAFAPEQTIHLAGLSKMGAPGLRIGFMHAPPRLLGRLSAAMAAASWTAAPMMAEIAARWIEDGTLDELLRRKREEARKRQEIAVQIFANAGVDVDTGAVVPPSPRKRGEGRGEGLRLVEIGTPIARLSSGAVSTPTAAVSRPPADDPRRAKLFLPAACFHAWLTLPEPWRARDFASEAEALGVRVTPADAFVSGRAEAPHAVRLCLGNIADRKDMKRGVEVLAQLLSVQVVGQRVVV